MVGELTEAAQQSSIGKDLIGVVHVCWASQRQLLSRPRRGADPDAIPRPTPVAGMALRRPARHVAGESDGRIEAARPGRQIHRLPLRVVEAGIGPRRVIAGVELPRAGERDDGLAERDVGDRRGRRGRGRSGSVLRGGTERKQRQQKERGCNPSPTLVRRGEQGWGTQSQKREQYSSHRQVYRGNPRIPAMTRFSNEEIS